MKKNIPINKGNYDMDTPERNMQFELNRGYGWKEEYSTYRNNWNRFPKENYVSEYPLLVDIELSSICNLKCPMCYTITDEFKHKVNAKLMKWELFTKIVDEIGGRVPAVRLSLRGEPTLHPQFIDCIQYCKQMGIKEVSFLTNGSKLTKDFFVQIAEAGADWITISIDGLGVQYESIRRPLKFEDIYYNLKEIKKEKIERGWKRPVIKAQGIWPAIKENPTEYYKVLADVTDLVAFNPLIDYLDNDTDIVYEDDFMCPQLYQRLVIGADGLVMPCSNDEEGRHIIGDISVESVFDIWHGEKINKLRMMHQSGAFQDVDVCRLCYIPRKTEDSERALVDGRELIIKNYIGRSQKIGE